MTPGSIDNSSETQRLLHSITEGRSDGWDELLGKHRERLRRMVSLRLDRRMRGWIDPSDVIRQAYADASSRRAEYLQQPGEPFFLWLRKLAGQKLQFLQQQSLGEPFAASGHDLSLHRSALPAATSFALAAQLLGQAVPVSQVEQRAQRVLRLEEALNTMDALEREVLALRHFERLNNAETAAVLELDEGQASQLYIRALKRVEQILSVTSGGPEEKRP